MSRHAAPHMRGSAAVTTLVLLIVLTVALPAGLWIGWYLTTRDVTVTSQTIGATACIVGLVADLIWMARTARALLGRRS